MALRVIKPTSSDPVPYSVKVVEGKNRFVFLGTSWELHPLGLWRKDKSTDSYNLNTGVLVY